MPDWLDLLIRWRILPALRFLHAVEGDHDKALWCFTLDGQGLAATNDVMAIERSECSRNLLPIFLKGSRVCHIDFRDDVSKCRFGLPRVNSRGTSNAYRHATQYCKRYFLLLFHAYIPPFYLCEQAFTPLPR